MAIEGVDYSFDRPVTPQALRDAGKVFACRYLAIPPNGKIIDRQEADQLAGAGVWIVANWEQGGHGNTPPEQAAAQSLAQARALGIPQGRPIYASVDFDVQPAQYGQVRNWIERFHAGLAGEYDGRALYGSYFVLKAGFDEGWLAWGWQTYAWSYGHVEDRAQLYQYHNGVNVAGADCDLDRAQAADYGQWMPGRVPDGAGTTDEEEPMLVNIQGKGGVRNGGPHYIENGHATFLGGQNIAGVPTLDFDQGTALAKVVTGIGG